MQSIPLMKSSITILILILFGHMSKAQVCSVPNDLQLVYAEDFSTPQSMYHMEFTDRNAWRIAGPDGGEYLELWGESEYVPPFRSPLNVALFDFEVEGDFMMEVRLAQTGREYGHRDLCLFFGVIDPSHFYYVHLASVADDHANNIFIVDEAARTKIADITTTGTAWGSTDSWHTATIIRKVEQGIIEVYFDDCESPVMIARNDRFGHGKIGFGSFDDAGKFDSVKIWSKNHPSKQNRFFKN